jgi:eukaryotic-like serine/threonine-protein kinase
MRGLEDLWSEISPLLDEALDLPSGAREAWLEDLEARAPELAAHVRSCLVGVADLADGKFLEAPLRSHLPTGLEGHTVGAYTLERPLGFGGMGTVWLAHRSDGRFEGQVAVKLLNAALVGHPSEQRFAREGRVLARLQHPNIARLLDAGVEAGRQPYLVLEYVRGERIDEYCNQRGLGIEQRVRLFLDVLAAVAHAHSNLVVHRDLKPSNILVTEQGEVKLLDFGIAALLSGGADDVTPLTRHMGPGLTPGYASPEQLLGQPITTAADAFALGTVLFELLAGRRPWSTRDEAKTSAELIRLKLETDAPRLSEAAEQAQWRRTLRGDLDNIVAVALRRNPDERYRTAEALAQDLRRYLAHEPVSARPRSFGYLIAKFVQRNRAAVVSASVVVIAIIVAGGFSLWQMVQANEQRRLAEDQASRAEFARDFAEFVLTDAGTTGRPFTTSELLARAEQAIEANGSTDSPMAIEQIINLGSLFARLSQHRKAMELFEKAYARSIAGNHAELRWEATCELGRMHAYSARLRQATELFDTGIAQLQRHFPDSPALVECLEQKSDLQLTKQEIAAAIATAQASVAHAQRVFLRARQHWIPPLVQLATAHRAAGHFQISEDLLRETLVLLKELGRERTADAMVLYNTWGIVKADIGDIVGAVRMFETSLGIGRALWGDATVSQWVSVNYGRRLLLLGRFAAAEENISNALQRSSGEDDAEMQAAALLGLIMVNRARGDLQAAKAARVRAEQFMREQLPPEHTLHVSLLFESGLLDLADNSLGLARTRLQQALAQFQRTNRRMSDQVVALVGLTRCELQSGDLARAAALATEATEFARKVALPDQPSYWLGLALLTEIDVQQALGHAGRVHELSVEALAQLTPSVGADHPLTRKAAALAGAG